MKLSKNDRPALVLIDIQKAFDDINYWGGSRNNPDAEKKSRRLLDYWRENNLPLFHIQHTSVSANGKFYINNTGHEFKDIVKPVAGESIIQKSVNSAFIGTNLKELLDEQGVQSIIIVGLTTDHCVSTTTRMAGNYGFNTYIVSDATATFAKVGIHGEHYDAEMMHLTALAHLNNEFATVIDTESLVLMLENKIASPPVIND
jgi:nicotinamidase-related amidase